MSPLHPEALAEIFPAFMDPWAQREWRAVLHHLIDFYVEANGHVLLEPGLSWPKLVLSSSRGNGVRSRKVRRRAASGRCLSKRPSP
jgi:hypothetical protein